MSQTIKQLADLAPRKRGLSGPAEVALPTGPLSPAQAGVILREARLVEVALA